MSKRNRERPSPMIHVQTYFNLTVAPFGRPITLSYGARVAVPARFADLFSGTRVKYGDFHLAIQLPGAFIVR